MTTTDIYENIKHVERISSNIGTACHHCTEMRIGLDNFAESVNHYMEKHGYVLLYIGGEADIDNEGKPCSHTVAIVGK
jgi:hypothetical protein